MSDPIFPNKMLILGNGFCLWFNLPTKYKDYKKFLEQHLDKYSNCYKMLSMIAKSCDDNAEWNTIEDDMYQFLCDNHKFDQSWNINIVDACSEKILSLNDWIKDIRATYHNELSQIKKILSEWVKTHRSNIWTFNYLFDWYKEPYPTVPTRCEGSEKRAVTELHLLGVPRTTNAALMFGGSWYKFGKEHSIPSNLTINDKAYHRFCTKFYNHNLCAEVMVNRDDVSLFFGYDTITNPSLEHVRDAIALPVNNWAESPLSGDDAFKTMYAIGFSFGQQDIEYFTTNYDINMLKHIHNRNGQFKISWYDESGLLETKANWKHIQTKLQINLNESTKFVFVDKIMEEIFGKYYPLLICIKENIQKKKQGNN